MRNSMIQTFDKILGCMLGGAIGDALGYPIEFYMLKQIKKEFGPDGVKGFISDPDTGKALVSDDTQMTIFTANGLLNCLANEDELLADKSKAEDLFVDYIYKAYREWNITQCVNYRRKEQLTSRLRCWVTNNEELWHTRAPGNTCLTSTSKGKNGGSIEHPINDSKGCGGVMRVAPVGIVIPQALNLTDASEIRDICYSVGCKTAALTHGDRCAYEPAGVLASIVGLMIYARKNLRESIKFSMEKLKEHGYSETYSILDKAYNLALGSDSDEENIKNIGKGWVGHEALAIAVYCAVRHASNPNMPETEKERFDSAIKAAVNHDGDSDSTGAITGNILGALYGLQGLPFKYRCNLECYSILEQLSADMFIDVKSWRNRYERRN